MDEWVLKIKELGKRKIIFIVISVIIVIGSFAVGERFFDMEDNHGKELEMHYEDGENGMEGAKQNYLNAGIQISTVLIAAVIIAYLTKPKKGKQYEHVILGKEKMRDDK